MPRFTIDIEGDDAILRALAKVPKDALVAMRRQAKDIATSLTDWVRIAGRSYSRQAARAATTVREGNEGIWPVITASNTGRARGLLFGSIFGMKRHTGWYAHPRYSKSTGQQFDAYIGHPGYWFFSTAEQRQPWIESEWQGAADEVVRRWSA